LADAILALLQVQTGLLELERSMLANLGLALLDGSRAFANSLMSLRVHGHNVVGSDAGSNEAAELSLVALLVLLLQFAHIFGNMTTENVLTKNFGIKAILFLAISGEALIGMRNIKSSIDGTLHGGKDLGTSGRATKADIEIGLEGTGTLLLAELGLVKTEIGQNAASAEQTGAIGGSIVRETNLDTIVGKFVGIGRSDDKVSLNLGIDDLADNISVGKTNNQTVLGGVVLVLVLNDQALASIVVCLALAASAILDLVALEIGLVFDGFDEWLQ